MPASQPKLYSRRVVEFIHLYSTLTKYNVMVWLRLRERTIHIWWKCYTHIYTHKHVYHTFIRDMHNNSFRLPI